MVITGKAYRSNAGALLVFTGTTPVDGDVFYVTEGKFYSVEVSGYVGSTHGIAVGSNFFMAMPQLNMSGRATVDGEGAIVWRGWAYNLQPELFQGELVPAEEDDSAPRIGTHFLVGTGDGNVVYISRDEGGSFAGYRVFIEQVSPEGGTLPRATILECTPMRDGSVLIATTLGSIDTAATSWRTLTPSDYDITETPTEVQFRKK